MIQSLDSKVVAITPPAAILDAASAVTNYIDTLGFDWLDIYVLLGATDIAVAALKLQECETSGGSYADIAGAAYGGTGNPALPGAGDDNKIFAFRVDLRTRARFIDLVATAGDGSAGSFISALGVLSRAEESPYDKTGRGCAAELLV